MKLPKSVEVMGVKLKVVQKPQSFLTKIMRYPVDGLMDWDKKTIYIDEGLPEEEKILTYIHEIVHASHFATGLNLVISPELLEIVCETTARTFKSMVKK